MRADHRVEAAAVHVWQASGGLADYATVRDHIASCPDCESADPDEVWWMVDSWQRGITASRKRARR